MWSRLISFAPASSGTLHQCETVPSGNRKIAYKASVLLERGKVVMHCSYEAARSTFLCHLNGCLGTNKASSIRHHRGSARGAHRRWSTARVGIAQRRRAATRAASFEHANGPSNGLMHSCLPCWSASHCASVLGVGFFALPPMAVPLFWYGLLLCFFFFFGCARSQWMDLDRKADNISLARTFARYRISRFYICTFLSTSRYRVYRRGHLGALVFCLTWRKMLFFVTWRVTGKRKVLRSNASPWGVHSGQNFLDWRWRVHERTMRSVVRCATIQNHQQLCRHWSKRNVVQEQLQ